MFDLFRMKHLLSVILLLHGMIHLTGFVKAFNLASVPALQSDISHVSGTFWFFSFILFLFSGITHLMNRDIWMAFALLGVVISAWLIIKTWDDAKFGMVMNVIIGMALLISFSGCSFQKKISAETSSIVASAGKKDGEIVTKQETAHLPAPVRRWLEISGVIGTEKVKTVSLKQDFLMKLKPEQEEWYSADALQYFTVEPPAFIWTVKMKMSPLVIVRGRDKFVDGRGEMLMKMNSIINLGTERGSKMDEGTLQRFLGETVWFPSAFLSPFITWESIDRFSAKATMTYKGTTGSGVFHFNEQGDFVRFNTMRYKGNESDGVRYKWEISVLDYSVMNNIKIPSRLSAAWFLDKGPWTWCELEVTELNYNITTSDVPSKISF